MHSTTLHHYVHHEHSPPPSSTTSTLGSPANTRTRNSPDPQSAGTEPARVRVRVVLRVPVPDPCYALGRSTRRLVQGVGLKTACHRGSPFLGTTAFVRLRPVEER